MPINDAPDSSAPARFAEPRAVRPDWYWSAPYIAVLIFALAMLVLVWVLQRQEGETQRNALARDVQWAEQTMRLHMQGTEDFLGQLARELAAGTLDADAFQVRANQHIANNPELVNVVWVAADQRVRWTAPFDTTDWLVGDALSAGQGAVLRRAQELGRPTYGEAYLNPRNTAVLELYMPVQQGREPLGAVVAVYSIERMVAHLVPSWFGEKYRLAFVGGRGEVLQAATGFGAVLFSGAVLVWLCNTLASVVRGTGNMQWPSAVLFGVSLLQIVVGGAFGLGLGPAPRWGMAGVALGNIVAMAVADGLVVATETAQEEMEVLGANDRIQLAQLERYCKRVFHLTPRQMIQKVRLEHAHRLLLTDIPITQVALQCGYTDHSAFTRQFKALTGFTPRQYRQATAQ